MAYLSKANQVRSFTPHKTKSSKKPKTDGKTPIPAGNKICQCGCGHDKYLSIHHVFGKSSRRFSNRFKCVEWLCYHSHQDSYGIHGSKNPNLALDYKLKIKHQARLMNEGMSINEFRFYFGKDYISMGYDGFVKDYKKEG
jgi:hypothetical protein